MKTLHYLMLVASLSCLLTAFAGDGEFDLQIERAVKVSFQTQAGKFYQLQSSPSVGPSVWTTQGGTIQGNGLRHEAGFLTGSNVQAIFRVQE